MIKDGSRPHAVVAVEGDGEGQLLEIWPEVFCLVFQAHAAVHCPAGADRDYGDGSEAERKEIIRNVQTLLTTPVGTCPLYRDFGLSFR